MKQKLTNAIVYGAMLLTACAVNRKAPGQYPKGDVADTSLESSVLVSTESVEKSIAQELAESDMSITDSTESVEKIYSIDEAIGQAILKQSLNRYASGECVAEGHYVMDSKEEQRQIQSYVLTMYGEYGFEDGNFVKVSGSGVIPAVLTFSKHGDGSYELLDYQMTMDGGMLLDSVMELFPEELWELCVKAPDEVRAELERQEKQYAKDYLITIGRAADIGELGVDERLLLTDKGVSVEVSNQISEKKALASYPFWIGDLERVEGGVRYLYEMEYSSLEKEIVCTKYQYDTGEIVERYVFDSVTGEVRP